MRPTLSQYAEALEVLSKEGTAPSVIAKNFFDLLVRRGEKEKYTSVVEMLETRWKKERGELVVTVVTASETTPQIQELLKEKARQIFPGYTVELRYVVDRRVVGGASFRTDESLYDATLASSLQELKSVLQ